MPDGLALDAEGNLFAAPCASDDIDRITPAGQPVQFANDRRALLLSRRTNLALRDEYVYAANLGRATIARAPADRAGKPIANPLCDPNSGTVGAMARCATPDDENGRLGLAEAKRYVKAALHGSTDFGVGPQSAA